MDDAISYVGNDLEAIADMPNYYGWIMEAFAPHVQGRVVEYGAGIGTVSCWLAPLAETLTLVEPSPNLVDKLRDRFATRQNINIVHARLEHHATMLNAQCVDTIVMVNVLEHIEDDRAALQSLVRTLRPGGHLLIFVPALQFLMSRLDRDVGHFRRYHRPDLTTKVRESGAIVKSCRYFDVCGVLPWFLLNTLLGNTKLNPAMVALNDRYAVPLSKAVEEIVSPPFGKNLILVAEKSWSAPDTVSIS